VSPTTVARAANRQRVSEIVNALVAGRQANVGGFVAPPNGGPKASVYYAVGAPVQASLQAPQDAPHGHLRLVELPALTEQSEDAA